MDDDAPSLRAALSLIDDLELDVLFATDLPTDHTPLAADRRRPARRRAASTPLPVTPGPYTGRNRRKLEIQALRQQEAELARQLEQAKKLRAVLEDAGDDDDSDGGSGSERAELKAAWEDLAQRQRAQREQAMQANESLRSVVGFQAKIAQQLLAKTRRALVTNGLLPQQPIDSVEFDWQSLSVEDHLAEVERMYAMASQKFSRPCFSSGRRDFQDLKVEQDEEESYVVTLDVAMMLPFSLERVADALWHHTTRMSSHERIYQFKDLAVEPSSMVSLFTAVSLGTTPEGCMQGQIATRRYKPKEASGVECIISKMVADVLKVDGYPFVFYGDGFLRCTEIHRGIPSSVEDGTTTSPLTQVLWHRRVHAKGDTTKTGSLSYLSSDLIAARMKDNAKFNLQTVENLLLTSQRRKTPGYMVFDCSRRSTLPNPIEVEGDVKLERHGTQKAEDVKALTSDVEPNPASR